MKPREQGMALLVVIIFMATMAAIAVNSNHAWYAMFNRTQSQLESLHAKWSLLGVRHYVLNVLTDRLNSTDNPGQRVDWPQADHYFDSPDGRVHILFSDGNACFNLNSLLLTPNSTHANNSHPANNATDAAIPDDKPGVIQGGEIGDQQQAAWHIFSAILTALNVNESEIKTLKKEIEQRSTDDPSLFSDISELRPLPGITRERYQNIAPMICVLPEQKSKINLNALGPQQTILLRALFDNKASSEAINKLITARPLSGWESLEDPVLLQKLAELQLELSATSKKMLDMKSYYFFAQLSTVDLQHNRGLLGIFMHNEGKTTMLSYALNNGNSYQ